MAKFDSGSYKMLQETIKTAHDFHLTQPVQATHGIQNENVIGDNVSYSKNAHYCYDCRYLEDCEYFLGSQTGAKDSLDIDVWGENMEISYNSVESGTTAHNIIGCWGVSEGAANVYYSQFCSRNVRDLFGCVGLRHKQYCILNKQYTKEEYEELVPKIIEHMMKNGEWGEFFDAKDSPFAYNETLANLYYPLSKEEVEKNGWKWKEEEPIPAKAGEYKIPDNIKDVDEDIVNHVLLCEVSKEPYKIIPQELVFYKKMKLPIPHKSPAQRHQDRMKLMNPHQLWDRKCAKCNKDVKSSYEDGRPEIVYCKDCYLKEVE